MWTSIDVVSTQFIQFIISIILARLLSPSVFGEVAILMSFVYLLNEFVEGGLLAALIQEKEVSNIDKSSVFYVMILIGAFLSVSFAFLAKPISEFFDFQSSHRLFYFVSINLFILILGSIQSLNLTKALDFKTKAIINLISVTISGAIGIWMAYSGKGVLSLVIQIIVNTTINTILLWIIIPWKPVFQFSFNSIIKFYKKGIYFFLSSILTRISGRAINLIIGKAFDLKLLGLYNRAESIRQLPLGIVSKVMSNVAFPVFSKIQDKPDIVRNVILRALLALNMILYPLVILIGINAEHIVLFLIGDKWLESVTYLRIIIPAAFFHSYLLININVLKGLGNIKNVFKIQMYVRAITIALIVIASFYSLKAVALVFTIGDICFSLIISTAAGRLSSLNIFNQLKVNKIIILPILLMILSQVLISSPDIDSKFLLLILNFTVGGITYLMTLFVFNRKQIINIAQFIFNSKQKT